MSLKSTESTKTLEICCRIPMTMVYKSEKVFKEGPSDFTIKAKDDKIIKCQLDDVSQYFDYFNQSFSSNMTSLNFEGNDIFNACVLVYSDNDDCFDGISAVQAFRIVII